METKIYSPQTEKEFEKYYQLRWRILRKPWNRPRGSEKDEFEESAIHIIAKINCDIIGVGRVHLNSETEAQIRYMAVEEKYRGKGIGSLILKALEKKSKMLGAKYIILNSRDNAIKFYEKNHYKIIGKAHTLFGKIEHWRMKKDLY